MKLVVSTIMYAIRSVKGPHIGKYYSWNVFKGSSWSNIEYCDILYSDRGRMEDFMFHNMTFVAFASEDKCEIVKVIVTYYKSSKKVN